MHIDIDRRNPEQSIGRRKQESSLHNILSSMEDVIVELDQEGNILFISKVLDGYDAQDILGRDFCDWAPASEHATMRATLAQVFASGSPSAFEAIGDGAQGVPRWYESRLSPVVRNGEVRSVILITSDITWRKQAELEAQQQAYMIQLFYNLPFIGMTITDPNTRQWIKVNDKFCEIMGYSRDELLHRTWASLTHPDDLEPSTREFERVLRGESNSYNLEKRFVHKDGSVIHATVDVHCARNADGTPDCFVATIQDITARKAQEAQIRHMAHHDLLTDLPNRGLLFDRLSQALLRAQREKHRLAVLFIDLDKFKPVNDVYGHEVGDKLLRAAAQRLQDCVRASDTVARMGGDEFVVLLSPVEHSEDVQLVARKLHAAIQQPFALDIGLSAEISSCIGIAIYPDHGSNEEELLRHADDAMYDAKEAGRSQVSVFGGL